MLKKLASFCALLIVVSGSVAKAPAADGPDDYQVVHGWPSVPQGFVFGAASGVAVDSHNHVWLLHRGPTRSIMAFDGDTGEVVASFGDGLFISPHGLGVDGDDNIWVTDATSGTAPSRHQVLKFSHDGKLMTSLGAEGVPGLDGDHFNQPTDIAVGPAGDLYVSDGYMNRRVVKFDGSGKFIMDWGNEGDADGQFALPHGIAVDQDDRVYVADRTNLRIQVFDGKTGSHLNTWSPPEMARPWGLEIGGDGNLYVMDGGHLKEQFPDEARIIKMDLSGKVLSTWSSFGQQDGQVFWGHDLAVGPDGAVYAVDVRGQRLQKFVPLP